MSVKTIIRVGVSPAVSDSAAVGIGVMADTRNNMRAGQKDGMVKVCIRQHLLNTLMTVRARSGESDDAAIGYIEKLAFCLQEP